MSTTVQHLATLVQGQVQGDSAQVIRAARPLQEAGPDEITFVENDHHLKRLKDCKASAVVVPLVLQARALPILTAITPSPVAILVKDSLGAFIAIAQQLHGELQREPSGIDPRAEVHPTAQVGPDASIQAFAVVGEGTLLGARCRIYPGVVIGRNCRIGDCAEVAASRPFVCIKQRGGDGRRWSYCAAGNVGRLTLRMAEDFAWAVCIRSNNRRKNRLNCHDGEGGSADTNKDS